MTHPNKLQHFPTIVGFPQAQVIALVWFWEL